MGALDEDDYSASFKTFDEEYSYIHGSYYPLKKPYAIVKMTRASFTITLDMLGIPCEERPFYVRFALGELMKPGRLWAVKDGRLIWAWAVITNYREDKNDREDTFSIDVSFDLPEGIWHKADKQKTFIVPFDPCDFMECYDFHDVQPCIPEGHCCHCAEPVLGKTKCYPTEVTGCCGCGREYACDCDCDSVEKEHALCYFGDYEALYNCTPEYRVIYNCAASDKFFGDFVSDERRGQKICGSCDIASGIVYSDTDIPTENVTLYLRGQLHNPYIEINGNGNVIKGDYDGVLEIRPDGSVYAYKDGCDCDEPLPTYVWSIPPGMEYGWTINPGNNRITVDGGTCCTYCAWVEVDAITV